MSRVQRGDGLEAFLPEANPEWTGTRGSTFTGFREIFGSTLEAMRAVASSQDSSSWNTNRSRMFRVVRGRRRILDEQIMLRRLAERCDQSDAVVHLPYLLSPCKLGTKIPHLMTRRAPDGEMESAVLFHEYTIWGVPTGVFVPAEFSGQQTVFAEEPVRSAVAVEAAKRLLRGRALIVLLTLRDGAFSSMLESMPVRPFRRAVHTRSLSQTLPLADTVDATLGALGQHTRRNLRHFRRRVVAELGATFETHVRFSDEEYLEMNQQTLYPVPHKVATCRLEVFRGIPGSFIVGLRSSDGVWLSLLGGRRYRGTTTVDWQMNTERYPALSLGTAMRAFVIEDEVARGTRLLNFDGGTPHTMHHSFVRETIQDLILLRWFLPMGWLRKLIPPRLPAGVLLSELLLSATLAWQRPSRIPSFPAE